MATDGKMEVAHELFMEYDTDGSGIMDEGEVKHFLQILKMDLTDEQLETLLQTLPDRNNVTEPDIMKLLVSLDNINFQQQFQDSLNEFDPEGKGYIEKEKLFEILSQMGQEPMSNEDAENAMAEIDTNGDGQIQIYEEDVLRRLSEPFEALRVLGLRVP